MPNSKIKLIWKMDFFSINEKSDLDLNKIFWEYIFDPFKSSKIIEIKKVKQEEIIKLKFLISKLKIAFILLKKIKYQNFTVDNILFSFNILNSYLEILNRFTWWIELKLFNHILIKEENYLNIESTIYYDFFLWNRKKIKDSLSENHIIDIGLCASEQILQLDILKIILKKYYNIDIKYNIFLWNLFEFENKENIYFILNKKLNNINNICFEHLPYYKEVDHILWHKYYRTKLFNSWCNWRKCSFCNFWKFNKPILLKNKEEILEKFILKVKTEKIKYLSIKDPSITVEELILLSKKIIKSGLILRIHIKTRFSNKLDTEVCKLLGQAWIRYIWIWLESISTRLNNFMNKYPIDYWVIDFQKLINNCRWTWIKIHYYTVFWFPTETIDEIIWTKDFLLKNIKEESNDFFSFTASEFWLNKWTEIYNNPNKYWITIDKNNEDSKVFIWHYEQNYFEHKQLINTNIEQLYKRLFLNININSFINFRNFFCSIEHSNLFHIQKMIYKKNPYLKFFTKNKSINIDNYNNFKYVKNKYFQYYDTWSWIKLINWVSWNSIIIDKKTLDFFLNINSIFFIWKVNIESDIIVKLISNYFLINVSKKAWI